MQKIKEKKLKVPKVMQDSILICKVGNEERPASYENILDVQQKLIECSNQKESTLVTHHAIEFLTIPRPLLKNILVTGHLTYEEDFDILKYIKEYKKNAAKTKTNNPKKSAKRTENL